MKLNFDKLFLVLITAIAIFFRFYNLSYVPPQPSVDEASIGYNAYSILKTGADEYGTKFPILLRAYDDFRPALFVYLVVPFVALFDLNVLAIRLPSGILGVLGVLGTYFLVKELIPNPRKFSIRLPFGRFQFSIAEISTLLLAVSPWHIYLSRLGHEVNASFSFLIFGLLFFFRFLNKDKRNLVLSALFFGLSFDSYQSTKIIVPLLLIALLFLFYKKLIEEKKTVLISALIGLLIIAPTLLFAFDENALVRFKATSLIGNSPAYFEEVAKKSIEDRQNGNIMGIIYNNQKVASVLLVSGAYLSHFDPVWLFSNKGDEPFKSPSIGLLYLFEFPLILISFLFLRGSLIPKKNIIFIIILGLIAVVPGGITTGYPHAMRAYSLLPVPQILGGIGLISLLSFLKNKKLQTGAFGLIALWGVISVLWFFHSYYSLLPRQLGNHFQYGVVKAFEEANKIDKEYELIVVSNKDRLFESYMFYLYSNKYDPARYQKNGGTKSGGFAQEHTIDNYFFGDIKNKTGRNQLYIINPQEKTNEMSVIKEIKYPNGKLALIIAETL